MTTTSVGEAGLAVTSVVSRFAVRVVLLWVAVQVAGRLVVVAPDAASGSAPAALVTLGAAFADFFFTVGAAPEFLGALFLVLMFASAVWGVSASFSTVLPLDLLMRLSRGAAAPFLVAAVAASHGMHSAAATAVIVASLVVSSVFAVNSTRSGHAPVQIQPKTDVSEAAPVSAQ